MIFDKGYYDSVPTRRKALRKNFNTEEDYPQPNYVQSDNDYKICLTNDKYYAMYVKKLARHKQDICIQPVHGATWLYSSKDPGSGVENVVIATNDPELLNTHPELGNNEIFNDYVKSIQ